MMTVRSTGETEKIDHVKAPKIEGSLVAFTSLKAFQYEYRELEEEDGKFSGFDETFPDRFILRLKDTNLSKEQRELITKFTSKYEPTSRPFKDAPLEPGELLIVVPALDGLTKDNGLLPAAGTRVVIQNYRITEHKPFGLRIFLSNISIGKRILKIPEDNISSEQVGADQPATAPQLKSEGKETPKPESEVRPR